MDNDTPDLPIYLKEHQTVIGVGTEGLVSEDLIKEIPFTDTYYIKLEVNSDTKEGPFAEGIYEIWRYGDKYRIHRYHPEDNEVEYIAICDGTRVMMTDFSTASITYEDYGAAYAFSEVAPLPNFRKLFADMHVYSSYVEDRETCAFSCVYPMLQVTDRVKFSKSTGIISYYYGLHGPTTLLSVDLISVSCSYEFKDYMFSFD